MPRKLKLALLATVLGAIAGYHLSQATTSTTAAGSATPWLLALVVAAVAFFAADRFGIFPSSPST